jgi:hypothetical protein
VSQVELDLLALPAAVGAHGELTLDPDRLAIRRQRRAGDGDDASSRAVSRRSRSIIG